MYSLYEELSKWVKRSELMERKAAKTLKYYESLHEWRIENGSSYVVELDCEGYRMSPVSDF
jgi:guanylate kinase